MCYNKLSKWYGYESRKNCLDGAWLNPKHSSNRQSAAKPEREGSTTISAKGSRNERSEVVCSIIIMDDDIVSALGESQRCLRA